MQGAPKTRSLSRQLPRTSSPCSPGFWPLVSRNPCMLMHACLFLLFLFEGYPGQLVLRIYSWLYTQGLGEPYWELRVKPGVFCVQGKSPMNSTSLGSSTHVS